ncbi:hypothetical protein ON010_g7121 [Phytophthora cinnamomi]|nr:hypothetical protein ON010_g7121 [Phytophthora cinnamomi]
MKLNPGVVCCDFELALLQNVKDQFPNANSVGCLFHWKQAIRRKMVALHIPLDQVKQSMLPGCLDLLTVFPRAKKEQGIAHVSSQLEPRRGDKTKWASFWKYFRATWLKRYDLDTWNVHHMLSDDVELISKTNNPLESYNRVFASQFHRSHPNLMTFMQVCKNESQRFFEGLRRIEDGVEDGSAVADVTYPTMPAALAD